MDRRDFLKSAIKIAFSIIGLLSVPFIVSLRPRYIRKKETKFFFLTRLEDMPRRDVKRYDLSLTSDKGSNSQGKSFRIYVVNTNKGWIALSPVCTHLGCLVNYSRTKKEFICPCHGGRYSIEGEVLGGPPPQGLTKLPLRIDNDKVYVGLRI